MVIHLMNYSRLQPLQSLKHIHARSRHSLSAYIATPFGHKAAECTLRSTVRRLCFRDSTIKITLNFIDTILRNRSVLKLDGWWHCATLLLHNIIDRPGGTFSVNYKAWMEISCTFVLGLLNCYRKWCHSQFPFYNCICDTKIRNISQRFRLESYKDAVVRYCGVFKL